MKILIVPDSFKGSLSSKQVCGCIEKGLKQYNNDLEITSLPFADGGEGFAECLKDICNGDILYTKCHNIYNQDIDGYIITFGRTAVIESAAASGLLERKNVMQSSSYGTGELINFAVSKGFRNIILGLGGSGCCDGGAGALAALGVKFYDESFNIIERPKSCDMNFIYGINCRDCVKDINFTYACDVDNEYFGKNGAAYIYAPQKGAGQSDVVALDEGLKRLNAFFKNDISKVKGAGAAGGICGGLYAVYGGNIKSGFDILSEYSNLEDKIINSDLIITGEGKTDRQTLMGKLPYKIAGLAKKHGKQCVIISGSIDSVKLGDKMLSLTDENIDIETAINNAAEILTQKSKYILQ